MKFFLVGFYTNLILHSSAQSVYRKVMRISELGLFEEPVLQFPGKYPLKSLITGRFFKKFILSPQVFTELKVRCCISVNWFEFSALGFFTAQWEARVGSSPSSDFWANFPLGWFAGRSWPKEKPVLNYLLRLFEGQIWGASVVPKTPLLTLLDKILLHISSWFVIGFFLPYFNKNRAIPWNFFLLSCGEFWNNGG